MKLNKEQAGKAHEVASHLPYFVMDGLTTAALAALTPSKILNDLLVASYRAEADAIEKSGYMVSEAKLTREIADGEERLAENEHRWRARRHTSERVLNNMRSARRAKSLKINH